MPLSPSIIESEVVVISATITELNIPFKNSIGHALKERNCSESVLVTLTDEKGRSGYGEGAPRDYVTGEQVNQIIDEFDAVLAAHPIPPLLSLDSIKHYRDFLAKKVSPSLVCAIEMAMLDLFAKNQETFLGNLLGPDIAEPIYSMVLPFMTLERMTPFIVYTNQLEIPHVKIKVGFEGDVEHVKSILNSLHPMCHVRLDANKAWTIDEAVEKCNAFRKMGIQYIEEPLREMSLENLRILTQKVEIKIGLDESLFTTAHARDFIHHVESDKMYFNLKLSKCGGFFGAKDVYTLAKENEIECQLGCNVGESSLLSAMGRIFASKHSLTFLEGSFSNLLLTEDVVDQALVFGMKGRADLLTLPGLGVTVNVNI